MVDSVNDEQERLGLIVSRLGGRWGVCFENLVSISVFQVVQLCFLITV